MLQRDLQNSANRLLARAAHYFPRLKQELLMSRAQRAPREGAVLFADSAEFCKSLFSLPRRAKLAQAHRAMITCGRGSLALT